MVKGRRGRIRRIFVKMGKIRLFFKVCGNYHNGGALMILTKRILVDPEHENQITVMME